MTAVLSRDFFSLITEMPCALLLWLMARNMCNSLLFVVEIIGVLSPGHDLKDTSHHEMPELLRCGTC